MSANWENVMIVIFAVYGLAFYSMGLALWIESGRASKLRFARSMRLLAAFGLLHGIHEWLDMVDCSCDNLFDITLPRWFFWIRLIILITSFVALIAFGEHMLHSTRDENLRWEILMGILLLYAVSAVLIQWVFKFDDTGWRIGMDALARYLLAIPGSLLACLALWQQRKVLLSGKLADYAIWFNPAIAALLLYGVFGQLFPANSPVFPSNFVNSDTFLEIFGFPVQLFRAVLACVIAICMIQILRILEVENREHVRAIERKQRQLEQQRQQELESLNEELLESRNETRRLLEEVRLSDKRRGAMLKHITSAQETERQRIARELHDDIGQVLTGLAMGLRGLTNIVEHKPQISADRLMVLEKIATGAVRDLRHLINDLRPPQLDDMGLVAAIRSMVERINEREMPPYIAFHVIGETIPLASEIEATLYRIAQEAITNAIKYAAASVVEVTINFDDCTLTITDDGKGFDVEKTLQPRQDRKAWGLYGIMERANLIEGAVDIQSDIGAGTTIQIRISKLDEERKQDDTGTDC